MGQDAPLPRIKAWHSLILTSAWHWLFSEMLIWRDMGCNSQLLAWKIPWMEEPGGLQSMGSLESDTTSQKEEKPTCVKMEKETV